MTLGYQSRSLENHPRDIVDRMLHEYPADSLGQVHLWLEDLRSDRLSRCALFLAKGSIKKLEEAVSLGRDDYRDLIVAAEYDSFRIQLRDFNRAFGSETVPNPLKAEWSRNQPNQPPKPTAPSSRGSS
jgi:hypothetical protein